MFDPLIIIIALLAGLLFKHIGLPAMIGYLLAGFIINQYGLEAGQFITGIANAGITLLLFSIGLKLNLRDLIAPRVWVVASTHMVITSLIIGGLLTLLSAYYFVDSLTDSTAIWTIAFALSFSSTVFAVKVFEQHGESAAVHANLAIAILVIQDLIAVFFLASSGGKTPEPTAILLLLLIPARPLLHRILNWTGHGELLILFGISLAFGGAALFEIFGVKGDLGALAIGALMAGGLKSSELAKSLLSLKDVFLVGFFLSIGLNGMPNLNMFGPALILTVLLVIKPIAFYGLPSLFKLRPRIAFLTSLSLSNYSEFGLIVVAMAAANGWLSHDWVVLVALAVTLSFFISAPINHYAHQLYNRVSHWLVRTPATAPATELHNVECLLLGMGRVGVGAYRYLHGEFNGKIAALEEDDKKFKRRKHEGYNVILADASDHDFWRPVDLQKIRLILISLTNHEENIEVVKLLKNMNYQGKIAVVARFSDELKALNKPRLCDLQPVLRSGTWLCRACDGNDDRTKKQQSPDTRQLTSGTSGILAIYGQVDTVPINGICSQ